MSDEELDVMARGWIEENERIQNGEAAPMGGIKFIPVVELARAYLACRAQVEKDARDAERYRWLRKDSERYRWLRDLNNKNKHEKVPQLFDADGYHAERLDAAIDAARKSGSAHE